jgi:glycosyltransferase involved in cell wall biosynthesis
MCELSDRRLRVMFFTPGPYTRQLYGTELSLVQLIERLDDSRFLVCGAVTDREGSLADALRERRVPVTVAPGLSLLALRDVCSWPRFAASLLWCIQVARAARPHVVHANGIDLNQHAALVARALQVPSICHLRLVPTARQYWSHLACLSNVVVANSGATAEPWGSMRLARRKLRVIYNGIDTSEFQPLTNPGGQTGRLKRSRSVAVGIVGRISPEKGHDVLLEALTLLPAGTPEVSVLVAGDAPDARARDYECGIRSLARRLGLDSRVQFLGPLPDPREVYTCIDVLVLPSRHEPFGRVVIEAMAMGLPVIATDAGGPSEIVVHGETGLLVKPGDPASLAEAIQSLVGNPSLRASFGRAGRERVLRLFSLEAHVESVAGLYEELVGCAPSRVGGLAL